MLSIENNVKRNTILCAVIRNFHPSRNKICEQTKWKINSTKLPIKWGWLKKSTERILSTWISTATISWRCAVVMMVVMVAIALVCAPCIVDFTFMAFSNDTSISQLIVTPLFQFAHFNYFCNQKQSFPVVSKEIAYR